MKTKSITKIAILTALFAIIAPIVIPFGLVPISLSTLILCVMSTIMKPKEIIISMVLYIIIGLIGIPVFASFQGGFGVLVGPTGGYLIGYIFAGFVMSLLNNIVKKIYVNIPLPKNKRMPPYITKPTIRFTNKPNQLNFIHSPPSYSCINIHIFIADMHKNRVLGEYHRLILLDLYLLCI